MLYLYLYVHMYIFSQCSIFFNFLLVKPRNYFISCIALYSLAAAADEIKIESRHMVEDLLELLRN